jgi:putative inorganic carbon (HCO3(-)) transporter
LITLRWKWGWVVILISILILVAAFGFFEKSVVLENILTSGMIGDELDRIEFWSRAILIIEDFPYTGVGMGLYGDVTNLMYPPYLHDRGSLKHAHNIFLQVAVDLGLPGLITWSAIFLIVICVSWKVYNSTQMYKNRNIYAIGLGAGLLCSQIAVLVHGLTDAVTWGIVRPAPILWVVWGLAVSTWLWCDQDLRVSTENSSLIQ